MFVTLPICYTRVIMHSSADVSGWWAADARAKRTGARPSSAVVEDGPTYGSYLYSSTAFGACREGLRRISLVTTADRCFFVIAQRSECRCLRLAFRRRRSGRDRAAKFRERPK